MKRSLFVDDLVSYREKATESTNMKTDKRVQQGCQIQDLLIKISSTFSHHQNLLKHSKVAMCSRSREVPCSDLHFYRVTQKENIINCISDPGVKPIKRQRSVASY